MRWWTVSIALGVALLSSGCATLVSAALGAALCGDSSSCRSDAISAGIEADGEILASAVQAAIESDASSPTRTAASPATTGGEAYEEPPVDAGGYYHCVDAEGHHVIELVAPSELDARVLCAAHLGVPWSDPEAPAVCACASRR